MNRLLILLTALCAVGAHAQEPAMNAAELAHALDRLAGTTRVLYVAAHPDDENTRLLAYLANGRHVTAAYLSMTRGGGGQNLIGAEQGELLDVIRTEELLAARGIDNATQRFTRMRDFGYSKRAEETFDIWGREEALSDVVFVVRTFQPDVIVTRFNERPPNHGHHTASALLAREAFSAAADPKRFPEQLVNGVTAWQATRLVHNFPTWRGDTPPEGSLAVDVGGYDPRFGLGFGELAALSRSQHKSQGFGVAGERGEITEHFVHLEGTPAQGDLLSGVPHGWTDRFGEAASPFAQAVQNARRVLHRDRPEQALPHLVAARRALGELPPSPRVEEARAQVDRLIAACAGLFIRPTASRPAAVPGGEVELSVEVLARRPGMWRLQKVDLPGGASAGTDVALEVGQKQVVKARFDVPKDAKVSVPYWLRAPAERGRYTVAEQALVGRPRSPPDLLVQVALRHQDTGEVLHFPSPVVFAWTDPVQGERVRPVLVQPPATVTPTREAVLSANGRPTPLVLRVRAARDDVNGQVSLTLPQGWRAKPASVPVALARAGDEVQVRFELSHAKGAQAGIVQPQVQVGDASYAFREDVIDHPHIPYQVVLQPSAVRAVPLQITLPKDPVAYVRGSGDTVAEDLAHVGMKVDVLDDDALLTSDLSRYPAIVLGVRAYNTRPAVRAAHERLMRYVEKGGTLVVQYNTNNHFAPLRAPIGPFPLEIGRDRITDETARVTPVSAKHPVLRAPNVLSDADWEGWVQERGIYFGAKWDDRYQPLFEMADPNEAPLRGSTLYARHGKGRYVYTGLAFFRQLPAGVPGAYRVFANLLGAPK